MFDSVHGWCGRFCCPKVARSGISIIHSQWPLQRGNASLRFAPDPMFKFECPVRRKPAGSRGLIQGTVQGPVSGRPVASFDWRSGHAPLVARPGQRRPATPFPLTVIFTLAPDSFWRGIYPWRHFPLFIRHLPSFSGCGRTSCFWIM